MSQKVLYDLLTQEEKILIQVLRTAIINAKSVQEIEEAKKCIGHILMQIPQRVGKKYE